MQARRLEGELADSREAIAAAEAAAALAAERAADAHAEVSALNLSVVTGPFACAHWQACGCTHCRKRHCRLR